MFFESYLIVSEVNCLLISRYLTPLSVSMYVETSTTDCRLLLLQ